MSFRTQVWGGGHSFERVITPETLAFHKRWELFKPHWYEDGHREDGSIIWSCCFGHAEDGDNPPFKMTQGETFTLEFANELLLKDIAVKARFVNAHVKVPLTTFMYGALISTTYQYGQGRFGASGLVIPAINDLNYVDAACEMLELHFNKDGSPNKGLKIRRACEVSFYMTKID